MADKKISQFDNGGAIQPTDEIATNRGGVNTKVFVGSAAALNTGNDPGDIPTNADLATQFAEIGKVKASSSDNFPSELVNKIIQGSNVSIDLEVDSSGNEYLVINASAGATSLPDGDYGDITVSGSGSVFTIKSDVVDTSNLGGDITAAGKALLDDDNAAAQRTTLGLGTVATLNTGISNGNVPLISSGTWTPKLTGASGGTNEHTLSVANGDYLKIGNLVFITFFITVSSVNAAATGGQRMSNLPFVHGNATAASWNTPAMAFTGATGLAAGTILTGQQANGSSHFNLIKSISNGSLVSLALADISNTFNIRGSAVYFTT